MRLSTERSDLGTRFGRRCAKGGRCDVAGRRRVDLHSVRPEPKRCVRTHIVSGRLRPNANMVAIRIGQRSLLEQAVGRCLRLAREGAE